MASITVLSCVALAAGFVFSVLIGSKKREGHPLGCVGSAFTAVLLGVAMTLAAGLSHGFCQQVLKFCAPTTDTTVWSVSYPLIAIPLYWILMLLVPSRSGPSIKGPKQSAVDPDET